MGVGDGGWDRLRQREDLHVWLGLVGEWHAVVDWKGLKGAKVEHEWSPDDVCQLGGMGEG